MVIKISRETSVYREKSVPMIALWNCGVQHSADFIIPEIQQPVIVIILFIYSPYLSKDLVEHRNIFQVE